LKSKTDLYQEDNYKLTLKRRMKDLQTRRPSLTWRKLAAEIPIQYTYLSKALNDEQTHLNEDHTFVLCQTLEFFPHEVEFILLQRAYATSRDLERQKHLYRRIREARRAQNYQTDADSKSFGSTQLNDQMRYLFEPLSVIVHIALFVPALRKDPRKLCSALSIGLDQLKEILRVLSRNDYIELEDNGLDIRSVKKVKLHFGPDHFLMRYNLALAKSELLTRISRTSETDKTGYIFTFVMDDDSLRKVREEFQTFLKKVERIAQQSKPAHVCQMSFDLLKWL